MFSISRCPFLHSINAQLHYHFCWWTGQGSRGLHRLSCLMSCTLTHGNPPYVLHRCKGLCVTMLCMSMIPTLGVLQEGKSLCVCVCPSIIGHGVCNERNYYTVTFNRWHNYLCFQSKIWGSIPCCQKKKKKEGTRSESTKLGLRRLQEFSPVIHCETGSLFISLHRFFPSSGSFPEEGLWEPRLSLCIYLYFLFFIF